MCALASAFALPTPEVIGRAEELDALRHVVLGEHRTVLTVWGSGGIGKTRLVREFARLHADEFPGGVHFCALAEARRATEIVAFVGEVLGLATTSGRKPADGLRRIGTSLSTRGRSLVVLDNVEQVVSDIVEAVGVWTFAAPNATFVLTSRELLGVSGETSFELSPLRLPRAGEDIRASDAVRLLVNRARGIRYDWDARPEVMAEIVTRLDGIPLAIELAAARLAVMSAEQVRDRLRHRFDLLATRHAGTPERQRALRNTIDWSWDLLDQDEQSLLAELSVFSGGFELQTVEALVGREESRANAATILEALRHKSLLVDAANVNGGRGGEPRFALLESIRDYAAEKLGDRAPTLRDRHAAYFAKRSAELAPLLNTRDDGPPRAWFSRERANLFAILDHFLERPSAKRAPWAIEVLAALQHAFSLTNVSIVLAEAGLSIMRAVDPFDLDAVLRMRGFEACGLAFYGLGQLGDSSAMLQEARGLAESGSLADRARILTELGTLRQVQGRMSEARRLHEEALALSLQSRSRRDEGHALSNLGVWHHWSEEFPEARERYEQSLVVLREVGDVLAEARTRGRLGFLMQDAGELGEAKKQYDEVLDLLRDRDATTLVGYVTAYSGNIARAEGRFEEAYAFYDRAIASVRVAGDRRFEAAFLMDRAIALELEERPSDALTTLANAAAIAAEVGDPKLSLFIACYETVAHSGLRDRESARRALDRARAQLVAEARARGLVERYAARIALLEVFDGRDGEALRDAISVARGTLRESQDSPRGEHARVAALFLQQTLDAVDPSPEALVVTRGRERLRLPGGSWIDVSSRPAVRRVLSALVDARLRSPGEPVSLEDLVQVGWPAELMLSRAGKNRLRVLLASVRANGFREILESRKGGYLLAASVPIVVTDLPPD
jgi:predicted ATPase